MSKEIRLLIQERLKGFKVGMTQTDIDSSVFDNTTMLKIEELSKEFDQTLVIEVMQNYYYFANMTIDSIPAKRIADEYSEGCPIDITVTRAEIMELYTELNKLFDELVIPSTDSRGHGLVKDPDEWVDRIKAMKSKYGHHPFKLMYDNLSAIKLLMWTEGYSEIEAAHEYRSRQSELLKSEVLNRSERALSRKGSDNTLLRHAEIQKIREELNNSGPFLELTADQQTVKQSLMDGMLNGVPLGRSLRVATNHGSNGHGYDISSNGSRHKKVVTGKAGNSYPIPKRRGVK